MDKKGLIMAYFKVLSENFPRKFCASYESFSQDGRRTRMLPSLLQTERLELRVKVADNNDLEG
jgi:hypothetical protein